MRWIFLILLILAAPAGAEVTDLPTGGFEVVQEAVVPGSPDTAWGEFTGDVSGWWDHSQTRSPARLVIEGHVGGQFYEWFDEEGKNGAIHATVIYADQGRKLVFDGPLGFSGHPLALVVTIEFVADGPDRTRVTATCRGAGEVQEGWAEAVDQVWYHFLVEQYQPWMEALAHGG